MKCRLCGGIYEVETQCVSSVTVPTYLKDEPWASMQGFVERRKCCKKLLGEGYGDVNEFKTKEEADEMTDGWKQKFGEWW